MDMKKECGTTSTEIASRPFRLGLITRLKKKKKGKEIKAKKSIRERIEAKLTLAEQRGQGMGMEGSRQGDGGASMCVCSKCDYEVEHERGKPCAEFTCPECGAAIVGKE